MFSWSSSKDQKYESLPTGPESSGSPGRGTKGFKIYRSLSFWLLIIFLPSMAMMGWVLIQQQILLNKLHPSQPQQMFSSIPKTLVTFEEDERFMDLTKDTPWRSLYPPTGGWIEIINPSKWGLYGGFPIPNSVNSGSEKYCLSVFHQLHCLASIQEALRGLDPEYNANHTSPHGHHSEGGVDPEHLNHCIDYIRQALMCAGDTTLEKAYVVDGKPIEATGGWGDTHECRDWDALMEFAIAHQG